MAVYPVIPGAPDYSTGSSSQYIPAIYSALLVKKFYPQTIFGRISNTDYEGDIKEQGDTVYIRTRPTIETFRYKKGMVLPVQNPESPYVTLKVDQGEGFSFALDKVDEFQSDINLMNTWADDASKQMQQVIDRNVLITLAAAGAKVANGQDTSANVTGYNTAALPPSIDQYTIAKGALVATGTTAKGTTITTGTTAGSTMGTAAAGISANTSNKIVSQLLYYGRLLDENNAPQEGRFVVLPSVFMQLLKDITAPFGQAYATGQNMANVLSGTIPKIDRFDIIFSNNIPGINTGTSGSAILFGCNYSTTFATQITDSRIIDNPFAFGKMMQGLQIYGFNVIKPQLLGVDFWTNS
jgi:hypothetical protein